MGGHGPFPPHAGAALAHLGHEALHVFLCPCIFLGDIDVGGSYGLLVGVVAGLAVAAVDEALAQGARRFSGGFLFGRIPGVVEQRLAHEPAGEVGRALVVEDEQSFEIECLEAFERDALDVGLQGHLHAGRHAFGTEGAHEAHLPRRPLGIFGLFPHVDHVTVVVQLVVQPHVTVFEAVAAVLHARAPLLVAFQQAPRQGKAVLHPAVADGGGLWPVHGGVHRPVEVDPAAPGLVQGAGLA